MHIARFDNYDPDDKYIEQDSPNMTLGEESVNKLVAKVDGRSIEVPADALYVTDTEHHECEVYVIEADGIDSDLGFLGFDELSAEGQDTIMLYLSGL